MLQTKTKHSLLIWGIWKQRSENTQGGQIWESAVPRALPTAEEPGTSGALGKAVGTSSYQQVRAMLALEFPRIEPTFLQNPSAVGSTIWTLRWTLFLWFPSFPVPHFSRASPAPTTTPENWFNHRTPALFTKMKRAIFFFKKKQKKTYTKAFKLSYWIKK